MQLHKEIFDIDTNYSSLAWLSHDHYESTIEIKYGELEKCLGWCSKNCIGEWGWNVSVEAGADPGQYNFSFASEKDLVAFTLSQK